MVTPHYTFYVIYYILYSDIIFELFLKTVYKFLKTIQNQHECKKLISKNLESLKII